MDILKNGENNDKQTQSRKSYLELLIQNNKLLVDKTPKTTGGVEMTSDYDNPAYTMENVFKEVAASSQFENINISDYVSDASYAEAETLIQGLSSSKSPDEDFAKAKALISGMIEYANKSKK